MGGLCRAVLVAPGDEDTKRQILKASQNLLKMHSNTSSLSRDKSCCMTVALPGNYPEQQKS